MGVDTFADWVRHVFDHPVSRPEWYWDDEGDWEPRRPVAVAYLIRLFKDPERALAGYSDEQLNQGLWYLMSPTGSDYANALFWPQGSWLARREAIRAIATLFERLFVQRCTDHLSHLDEPGSGPLNPVCYMWWDLTLYAGRPNEALFVDQDVEVLAVMKRILGLDSVACQESALHGLGHWHYSYPELVREAVDEFLDSHPFLRPALRNYAVLAREGWVE